MNNLLFHYTAQKFIHRWEGRLVVAGPQRSSTVQLPLSRTESQIIWVASPQFRTKTSRLILLDRARDEDQLGLLCLRMETRNWSRSLERPQLITETYNKTRILMTAESLKVS